MENKETQLSAQESLRVIRETIDIAKNGFREDGFHFLLWGWLVAIASFADWYLWTVARHPDHAKAWMIMAVVGVPVSMIREWRLSKKVKNQNVVRDWYGFVWLGFGISMLLIIPSAVMKNVSPVPFILAITGMATFMSGILLRFTALIIGAAVIWAGCLWCMFLPVEHHLLVQGFTAVLGYLVPGYLLNHQARKHVPGA
ncbi:MAG: hypothetical protein JNJ57_04815 [Saprospiraceae bacterium]|nr:hypothetical protein [Saprospiraceae bacterium]